MKDIGFFSGGVLARLIIASGIFLSSSLSKPESNKIKITKPEQTEIRIIIQTVPAIDVGIQQE